MASIYFDALFGDVPMHVASIETTRGRDLAVQSPTSGDLHTLADRGLRPVSSRWEILFVDRPNLAPYLERYETFCALVESGKAQILSHPLDGTYLARASELQVNSDSSRLAVQVSCTFHRETAPADVLPVGPGTQSFAGAETVAAFADTAAAALASVAMASDIPAKAAATFVSWEELDEVDTNEVALGVSDLAQRIDAAIEDLDLLGSLEYWPAYQAFVQLRYTIVRAGEALTAAAATTVSLYVANPRPLRSIIAEVYGAEVVDDLVDVVVAMNRLRTPARVPAGTTLLVPRTGAR